MFRLFLKIVCKERSYFSFPVFDAKIIMTVYNFARTYVIVTSSLFCHPMMLTMTMTMTLAIVRTSTGSYLNELHFQNLITYSVEFEIKNSYVNSFLKMKLIRNLPAEVKTILILAELCTLWWETRNVKLNTPTFLLYLTLWYNVHYIQSFSYPLLHSQMNIKYKINVYTNKKTNTHKMQLQTNNNINFLTTITTVSKKNSTNVQMLLV